MRALTFTKAIEQDPQNTAFLGCEVKAVSPSFVPSDGDVMVEWGEKPKHGAARAYAKKHGLPFWTLEDGFLAFWRYPTIDPRRMSMIVDKSGIFYNAQRPSDLETLLSTHDVSAEERAEARRLIESIKSLRVSKYNHAPLDAEGLIAGQGEKPVLVIDQTFGDRSIALGLATEASFQVMLDAALDENPGREVWVKVHPDVLAGRRKGHYTVENSDPRVRFVADNLAAQSLFEKVGHVYAVGSQMGFEALIAGLPVTVFGVPFYAGWGLTDDRATGEQARVAFARRGRALSIEEMVAIALIRYPLYRDPFLGKDSTPGDLMAYFRAERAIERPTGPLMGVSFSFWKRSFLGKFAPLAGMRYGGLGRARKTDTPLLVWGRKSDAGLRGKVPAWRMEDGFLRSVGLGSDLYKPGSLSLDQTGIYYDAEGPSDLETYLNTKALDLAAADLARAASLRQMLVESRLSKYNVGDAASIDFRARAGDRPVFLVPGQVEGDASIRFGSPKLKTNAELLQTVRSQNPDAYIVYKPHPDLVVGNRDGGRFTMDDDLADEVIIHANIIDCLSAVDAVHVMTSLTGFEALLRAVPVHTYGCPFYAGWGLTHDWIKVDRRTATLSLDQLVYGALIVYARYVSWPTGLESTPEAMVQELAAARAQSLAANGRQAVPFEDWIMRRVRKALYSWEVITKR